MDRWARDSNHGGSSADTRSDFGAMLAAAILPTMREAFPDDRRELSDTRGRRHSLGALHEGCTDMEQQRLHRHSDVGEEDGHGTGSRVWAVMSRTPLSAKCKHMDPLRSPSFWEIEGLRRLQRVMTAQLEYWSRIRHEEGQRHCPLIGILIGRQRRFPQKESNAITVMHGDGIHALVRSPVTRSWTIWTEFIMD